MTFPLLRAINHAVRADAWVKTGGHHSYPSPALPQYLKIKELGPRFLFPYAGGVIAISRWLSAATPPVCDCHNRFAFFTPEALQRLAGG